jgi:hypothetical protein
MSAGGEIASMGHNARPLDLLARLTDEQAWALAQFAKRIYFSDIRQHAVDDAEAYVMRDAIVKLQASLADAGYAPR